MACPPLRSASHLFWGRSIFREPRDTRNSKLSPSLSSRTSTAQGSGQSWKPKVCTARRGANQGWRRFCRSSGNSNEAAGRLPGPRVHWSRHELHLCKIVEGQIPSTPVYQDDLGYAFADLNPKAPVHVLIVPREHIGSIAEAGKDKSAFLGHLLWAAAEISAEEGASRSLSASYGEYRRRGWPDGRPPLHLHLLGGRGAHLATGIVAQKGFLSTAITKGRARSARPFSIPYWLFPCSRDAGCCVSSSLPLPRRIAAEKICCGSGEKAERGITTSHPSRLNGLQLHGRPADG